MALVEGSKYKITDGTYGGYHGVVTFVRDGDGKGGIFTLENGKAIYKFYAYVTPVIEAVPVKAETKEEIFFRTTSARTLIDVPYPLTESQKALVLSMLTMMQKP